MMLFLMIAQFWIGRNAAEDLQILGNGKKLLQFDRTSYIICRNSVTIAEEGFTFRDGSHAAKERVL